MWHAVSLTPIAYGGNDFIMCSRMFCQLQDVDFMPAGLIIHVHKEGVIVELCKLHMYVSMCIKVKERH